MEWTQIAAWIVWAWVGIATFYAVLITFAQFRDKPENMHITATLAASWSLLAILGLMLIQTLGLAV